MKTNSFDGRWVLIGILGGTLVEQVNLWDLLSKRVQLIGTLITQRSDAYKANLTKEFAERALPLFVNGKLQPIVDKVFTIEDTRYTQERMEINENIIINIINVNKSVGQGDKA